jgi:hypothetical protein
MPRNISSQQKKCLFDSRMAAILASNAASSILGSILLGSDFPIVRFLSLFFFEKSIAKNITSFLASLFSLWWPVAWTGSLTSLILNLTEILR